MIYSELIAGITLPTFMKRNTSLYYFEFYIKFIPKMILTIPFKKI